MADNADLTVLFRVHSTKNNAKSKEKGRPIYDDMEVCEIRTPGDKNSVKVFPALAMSHWVTDADGDRVKITYAERFREQYRRFKDGLTQVQSGTPLEELTFLPQSKRLEFKALSVYTAEQLAALDGQHLKALGQDGRKYKDQAQAYLDNASGSAKVTEMADEIASLRQQIADLQTSTKPAKAAKPADEEPEQEEETEADKDASPFEDFSDTELKEYIEQETGSKPRGNPSHETLVRMCDELEAEKSNAA